MFVILGLAFHQLIQQRNDWQQKGKFRDFI